MKKLIDYFTVDSLLIHAVITEDPRFAPLWPLCIRFSMVPPEKLDISLQIEWVIVELKKWKDVTILEF